MGKLAKGNRLATLYILQNPPCNNIMWVLNLEDPCEETFLVHLNTGQNWHTERQINITCILLIPTTSDRWMKAFRKTTYPCDGPNSKRITPFFSREWLLLNPSPSLWLLPHPECRVIYNLYNDVLYKIEKSRFYKGFFSKRKKYQILSIKKENIVWNDFPQQYINVNAFFVRFVFSSHAEYTCIYNT